MKKEKGKTALKYEKILGIKVNSTSVEQVLRKVRNITEDKTNNKKLYIVTPNPEHVMQAQDDGLLKDIINSADISIPDGIGLVAASKFKSLPRPQKIIKRIIVLIKQGFQVGISVIFDQKWLQSEIKLIKGREMFVELLVLANKKNWKVVLLGDYNAVKAASLLRQNYKGVEIHSMEGAMLDKNANPVDKQQQEIDKKVVTKINNVKPHLLFVGLGSPKQEKWLYRHLDKLDIKVAMVVGGTFDYISGKRKSTPGWIEGINMEWLWRLFTGSQKPSRVLRAFPTFPLRVFLEKLVGE